VIVVHASAVYSGIAEWYYQEVFYRNLGVVDFIVYGTIMSFAQAWSMGLMFFIAAYWAAKSFKKYGVIKFLKSRFIRLGIPLVLYVLFIVPFIFFVVITENGVRTWETIKTAYVEYYPSFKWLNYAGTLWFVEALLMFCIVYAVFRTLFPKRKEHNEDWLNNRKRVIIVISLIAVTFVVRIWFSIITVVHIFKFAFLPEYIVLFIMGIIAGERDSLDYIASPKNVKLCLRTLCICVPIWLFVMILGGALEGKLDYIGGWHWQSLFYTAWDICLGILFNIGLIAFFKKYVNISNKFTRLLSDNSFGIYVFHSVFVTLFPVLLKDFHTFTLIKWLIVISATCVSTLAFTAAVRKIKAVRMVL
jgi:hypothetical protein